jgi:cellulose synthase operon protein C
VVLGDAASVRAALRSFDAAVAADPRNVDATLRTGDLFLDKYNAPEARESYTLALQRDSGDARALLGMARVLDFEGKADALTLARRSAQRDPQLVEAQVLLARLHLEAEQYDSARIASDRALALDSLRLAPWALLGATAWLTADSLTYARARAAAERLHPRPAEFEVELAEAAVRNRRYADAVRFASRAVEADSGSARAWGVLGTNQLRLGQMADGRASLERAFALDPFHLWHKNTLDLLDQLDGFAVHRSARIELVAPAEDADALALHLLPLLEEAFDSLARRYAYTPPTPIRLELYRRHADFSVRTVGLAGLGALGVSFGTVLAMDAPGARGRGEFNWGSTAWHELAHTFTLGASGHRVPRWLSEGLSVLEERRARPWWGAKATLGFVEAYKARRLRPVSQLGEGFVRPRSPQEVGHSYLLASYAAEFIEAQAGAAALPALLQAYRDGLETPAAFARVLRTTPTDFDARFDAWMAQRFAAPLAAIAAGDGTAPPTGAFPTAMREAAQALEAGDRTAARRALTRARTLFPEYAGADGPDALLAALLAADGDPAGAATAIATVTRRNETAWEPNAREADWREASGDTAGAAAALSRLQWMSPLDIPMQQRLATLAARSGDHATALRARRTVVALRPTDLLEARYQLARALADAGDRTAARREVLAVLEQAPGFEKAQALLLELRGGPP